MTTQPRELIILSRTRRLLAEAACVDQIRDIRDKAQAVRQYAKKTGIAQEIIVDASAIKVEAERKLGQLLRDMPLPNASPGNQHTSKSDRSHDATGPVRLRDLGVTKSESSRAQRIAGLPDADFNRYIKDNVQAGREPTMAGVLRLARDMEMAESVENHQPRLAGVVNVLNELVEQGSKFGTIYADPPWPYDNQGTRAATGNHYPTMSMDEIRAEPVSDLAADNCHLHLWTTNSFLPDALDLIDTWGFTYKSMFVWVKPTLGLGNYWRCAHELLLLGVKGNRPFLDKGQRSWSEAKRTGHSSKPKVVREIIEKVSPGPYLEMYGRSRPINSAWTVYGNQISPMSPD